VLKISQALAGWKAGEKIAARSPVLLLEGVWDEIVGSEVAQNSHPAKIADGALTIITRSGAWSQQLSFLAEHILRAVAARMPEAGVDRVRFRVGRLLERRGRVPMRRRTQSLRRQVERAEPASPAEALARFRRDVEQDHRARRSAGWNECRGCGALVVRASNALCGACAAARDEALAAATARLLFEAPWLGYAGTALLVDGLQQEEYRRIRIRLLAHWWQVLARARVSKRLSRDGRERLVASSYVLLHSKLPPEEIMPETVRSILGDELHDILYGKPENEGRAVEHRKRRM
jgi:hypothetical protein